MHYWFDKFCRWATVMPSAVLRLLGLINCVLISCILVACTPSDNHSNDNRSNTHQTQNQSPLSNPKHPKIITPDWSIAATLTALGTPPVATGDINTYPQWSLEPALPNDTLDMGARFNPNPELIAQLSADMVVTGAFYEHLHHLYKETPIITYQGVDKIQSVDFDSYANATRQLAIQIGLQSQADKYIKDSQAYLVHAGQEFKHRYPNITQLAIVQFASPTQLRSYTDTSPFAPALQQMGLKLVSFGKGNLWGSSDIRLSDLSTLDKQTCLVVIEPFSPMLQKTLAKDALWQRLGFGKERCLMILPPVWAFGDIPSMTGLAHQLNKAKALGVTP